MFEKLEEPDLEKVEVPKPSLFRRLPVLLVLALLATVVLLLVPISCFLLFQPSDSHSQEVTTISDFRTTWVEATAEVHQDLKDYQSSKISDKKKQEIYDFYHDKLAQCWNDTNPLATLQSPCATAYMFVMSVGEVVELKTMKWLSPTGGTKPGFALELNSHYKGYWKACNSHQGFGPESYESELIAFHVGQTLGIARTAVVVGRTFPGSEIREKWPAVANRTTMPNKMYDRGIDDVMKGITDGCADEKERERDIVKGAMKGWMRWEMTPWQMFGPELSLHSHFLTKYLSESFVYLDMSLAKTPGELKDVMERIRIVLWCYLTGWYTRADHNVDIMHLPDQDGPVVMIDNDRTYYKREYPDSQTKKFITKFIKMCTYPDSVYTALDEMYSKGSGLGDQVMYSLRNDPGQVRHLHDVERQILNQRGAMMYKNIKHCIRDFGYDKVIYEDPADGPEPFKNIEEQYALEKFEEVRSN